MNLQKAVRRRIAKLAVFQNITWFIVRNSVRIGQNFKTWFDRKAILADVAAFQINGLN